MIFFCGSVYFGQVKKKSLFFSVTISRGTPVEKPWFRGYNLLNDVSQQVDTPPPSVFFPAVFGTDI
jgi:hypothetical protein